VRWRQLAADGLGYHVHQAANFLRAGFELVGGPTSHAHAWGSSPWARAVASGEAPLPLREPSTMPSETLVTYEVGSGLVAQ
jgi:hypothetical protein